MQQIINDIISELQNSLDPKYRDGERHFFKEPIKNFGVRLPERRKIAAKFWPQVKKLNKKEMFKLAEKMWQEKYNELATIASSRLWQRGL